MTTQRLALIAIITAALLAVLLGRYTIVPSERRAAVYRLNRLTGTVALCETGKDETTCQ